MGRWGISPYRDGGFCGTLMGVIIETKSPNPVMMRRLVRHIHILVINGSPTDNNLFFSKVLEMRRSDTMKGSFS
jgi:hypothetical protein